MPAAAAARFRRWWLLVVPLAAVAAWGVWRSMHPSTPARLFAYLPADDALHLYIDANNARSSETIRVLFSAPSPAATEYRQFVDETGFNYLTDLDAAALSLSGDRIFLVAQGRFQQDRILAYLAREGANCEGSLETTPCAIPASRPGRLLSFQLLDEGLVAVADAPDPDAVSRLATGPPRDARAFATEVQTFVNKGGLLWVTFDPPSLERAMQDPPASALNLMLFAKALELAERGFFGIEPGENASLILTLSGLCSSEEKAEKLGEMLRSLNRLLAGAIEMGDQGGPPSPWLGVVRSGKFMTAGTGVEGRWTLPEDLLRRLAAQ